MDYIQKIKLLYEVVSKTLPQDVDFTPQTGAYYITLLATQAVDYVGDRQRDFKIMGRMEEGKTLSASLIVGNDTRCKVSGLPYVAHDGDRTPIYKILRASIYCAYGALQLPWLHRKLKQVAWSDYPFTREDREELQKAEVKFTKKLAEVCSDKKLHTVARATLIHPSSTRLKDVLMYNKECEPDIYDKMKASIEALKPFAPGKEDTAATPDIFIWDCDPDYPRTTDNHRVFTVNAKLKSKQQFWWDYLKLNILLGDLDYNFGYYVLINRWRLPALQKWIAEYREKGYFESQRAKDFLLFYLKSGEKTKVRILNSDGVQISIKLPSR